MKSDADLQADVQVELKWDPAAKDTAVGVTVEDGVVTLSGHLKSHAQRRAVEHAARRVHGVRALATRIDVRVPAEHERSDADILLVAERALEWNVLVPHENIGVRVDKGRLKLVGKAEWQYQRQAAADSVRDLLGVTGIDNQILVVPQFTPTNVQTQIEDALKRQAQREAHRIEVLVSSGDVTLRGKVHSWAERRAAEGAAWAAPGVRHVVNNLLVQP